jgi:hypothetical protein
LRTCVLAPLAALLLTMPCAASMAAEGSVAERASREVVELHDFLADWFNGRLPGTESAFARFDTAIADDFVIIGPDGSMAERAAIVKAVFDDWGRWQNDETAGIEVRNARVHEQGRDLVVVSYEEWQTTATGTVVRLSTVVLRHAEKAPLGLEWVHLHETWMPND